MENPDSTTPVLLWGTAYFTRVMQYGVYLRDQKPTLWDALSDNEALIILQTLSNVQHILRIILCLLDLGH